jgi:hypothetical protein
VSSKKYQLSDDLGIELLLVGRDGIRFQLFGLSTETEPEEVRLVPVQAASPPPDGVDGRSWREIVREALRRGLTREETERRDVPRLQKPARETIVLDQEIMIPFDRGTEVVFGEEKPQGEPVSFLANRYPQQRETRFDADYYEAYQLRWAEPLSRSRWVAISFDRFNPESAVIVARATDERLFPEQQATPDKPVHEKTAPSSEMPEHIWGEGPERQWVEPLLEFARRNGWTFDEAARLSVETVIFFEQQDNEGVTVIVRPPPGRTPRERRARRARRVRFAFKNPRLSQPENPSSTTWRWWQ